MTGSVRCRCPHGTPLDIETHGLAPAGWNKPARPASGPPLPDCALCGNTGRASVGRVRAARAGGVLLAAGWFAGPAGLVLLVAWLLGLVPFAAAGGILAIALLCSLARAAIERRLLQTG